MARVLNSGLLRRRRRSGAGAFTILDTFTRADNTSSPGTADTGQPWTVRLSTLGILSGKLYVSSIGGTNLGTLTAPKADVVFAADGITSPTANRIDLQWLIHYVDNNNYISFQIASNTPAGNITRLYRILGGAFASLASGTGVTVATSTTYRPVITTSGPSIQVALPGMSTINVTLGGGDAVTFPGSTNFGLGFDTSGGNTDDGGSRFDNLSITG